MRWALLVHLLVPVSVDCLGWLAVLRWGCCWCWCSALSAPSISSAAHKLEQFSLHFTAVHSAAVHSTYQCCLPPPLLHFIFNSFPFSYYVFIYLNFSGNRKAEINSPELMASSTMRWTVGGGGGGEDGERLRRLIEFATAGARSSQLEIEFPSTRQ